MTTTGKREKMRERKMRERHERGIRDMRESERGAGTERERHPERKLKER